MYFTAEVFLCGAVISFVLAILVYTFYVIVKAIQELIWQHKCKIGEIEYILRIKKEKATKDALRLHLSKDEKYIDWDYVKNLEDRIDKGYYSP